MKFSSVGGKKTDWLIKLPIYICRQLRVSAYFEQVLCRLARVLPQQKMHFLANSNLSEEIPADLSLAGELSRSDDDCCPMGEISSQEWLMLCIQIPWPSSGSNL